MATKEELLEKIRIYKIKIKEKNDKIEELEEEFNELKNLRERMEHLDVLFRDSHSAHVSNVSKLKDFNIIKKVSNNIISIIDKNINGAINGQEYNNAIRGIRNIEENVNNEIDMIKNSINNNYDKIDSYNIKIKMCEKELEEIEKNERLFY